MKSRQPGQDQCMGMSIFRKFRSALDFLIHGRFVKFFNALTTFLRLHPAVMIGDTYLYTVEPFDCFPATGAPFEVDEGIRCETDPAIIEKLLACMEGTADYPSIKPENRRKKFENLFRQGSRVWVVENGPDVLGFLWETRRRFSYTYGDRTLVFDELPDNAAFIEFLFVNEAWRRLGLHAKLIEAIHRASPSSRFSGPITEDNEPSIRSHEIYGFRRNGRILHFRCFGLVFASLRFGKIRRSLFRIRKGVPYRISCKEF